MNSPRRWSVIAKCVVPRHLLQPSPSAISATLVWPTDFHTRASAQAQSSGIGLGRPHRQPQCPDPSDHHEAHLK
ncbi:Hypothetical protein, putative [Bodo saltans]|uniref:Uncharacterized protein n=1 Tax=Bodo saltans TaxID=75058 RepID=A0A0S4JEX8_BODSA|nr:Hypothetical protein, putative [Bodo saltans]|eukprot:CUG87729.1 Hypothetical protein, putative [Bodo saltans]